MPAISTSDAQQRHNMGRRWSNDQNLWMTRGEAA
jgi:hypothetical protein